MNRSRRQDESAEAVNACLHSRYTAIFGNYLKSADPPTTLYHYCPEQALFKILESGHLWASDILRMNDQTEISYAFSTVIDSVVADRKYFIKSVKPADLVRCLWGDFGSTHIACLSARSDSRNQWEHYAKWTGYAIGFDWSALNQWCSEHGISLLPMSYDTSCHKKMIEEILEDERLIEEHRDSSEETKKDLREETLVYLACLAATMKEPGWKDEEEWRIFFLQSNGVTTFEVATRDNGVKYIKIPVVSSEIVTEVVLGPSCCADLEKMRLEIEKVGWNSLKLRRCACPE